MHGGERRVDTPAPVGPLLVRVAPKASPPAQEFGYRRPTHLDLAVVDTRNGSAAIAGLAATTPQGPRKCVL